MKKLRPKAQQASEENFRGGALAASRCAERAVRLGIALACGVLLAAGLAACSQTARGSKPTQTSQHASGTSSFKGPSSGYIVYWDQDEEEDYYQPVNGSQGQLVTPWDPNGQMCLLNDGTGRSVIGYDPTNANQDNPGGPPHHPFKQPPIGEEVIGSDGKWTGQDLYVSGPYKFASNEPGEDSPINSQGQFNGQSTYTGCAVDSEHNVFADDIGTAQGQFPIPTDGRLVEWFAPSYKTYCILYGPSSGGVDGAHHVDGTGGLSQPGMMTQMPNGNLLLPQAGSASGQFGGQVTEFDHSSFPKSAAQCPDGVYPRASLRSSVFVQGSLKFLPVPMGVAFDPSCGCYAVDSIFGDPTTRAVIEWFAPNGKRVNRPAVTGETLSQFGHDPNGFNPFGMAFAPDGTLYFIDIHIMCSNGFSNCGPQNFSGRVMRITFGSGMQPSKPKVIATDFAFPTSVTICVIGAGTRCPFPTHKTPLPSPETRAEAGLG